MISVLVVEDNCYAYNLMKNYHALVSRSARESRNGLVGAVLSCIKKIRFVRVTNAQKALKKLRAGYRPDAVVTDQMLDGMKGTEWLEIANSKSLLDGVPRILFTSAARDEYEPLAQKVGAIYKYKGEPRAFENIIFRLGAEIYNHRAAQPK